MNTRLVFLVFPLLTTLSLQAYDPTVTGPAPTYIDRNFAVSSDRILPVRIFLPNEKAVCPVIVFSHGLGGSREGSNFLGRHWSSRSYVTVFLQHPGSDSSVWQGEAPGERLQAMKRAASGAQFMNRVRDVKGTLDLLTRLNADPKDALAGRLDLSHIGMSGHSFGAMTTQAVAGESLGTGILGKGASLTDTRIRAAVIMSPSPLAKVDPQTSFGAVALPWLLMTGTHDGAPSGLSSVTPADRLKIYPALPPGDKYELVLDQAEHSVFTDRKLPGEHKERNPNHHRVILATSTAFWDATLKNDAAAAAWLKHDARSVMEEKDCWQFK
ncbi:MAG: hypothetical protein SFU85_05165 [Candidatus Methylacidiphilales bacterium]|nr:hypothetical protein [Candidatus Methylacidiphilales bacterium]